MERVESQVEPLLGAVELKDVPEKAERVFVRHAEDKDLHHLDDVLDHVPALDGDAAAKNQNTDSLSEPSGALVPVVPVCALACGVVACIGSFRAALRASTRRSHPAKCAGWRRAR